MKKGQVAVTLDTLKSVAKAFKVQPWEFLIPGSEFDVSNQALPIARMFDQLDPARQVFVIQLLESHGVTEKSKFDK